MKSLKIKENDPEWQNGRKTEWDTFSHGEREKFSIWSSTSACETLEEICVCNSYVCAAMKLYRWGPMRPLEMKNFARLKSIRIEMYSEFWEEQMSKICYTPDSNESLWTNRRPSHRVSLIGSAPNLENLSIKYKFNQTRSQSSKKIQFSKLQLQLKLISKNVFNRNWNWPWNLKIVIEIEID